MTYQRPSFGGRLILAWGVARRMLLHWFRPGYIRVRREQREGSCARCGACCRLTVTCPHVVMENGLTSCNCHSVARLPNCINFPIDPRDLADRTRIAPPGIPCGYFFPAKK
jgi:hypothetical protein